MDLLSYLSFPNSSINTGNMTVKELVVSERSSPLQLPVHLGARSTPLTSAISVGR